MSPEGYVHQEPPVLGCRCSPAALRRGWSTECPVPTHRLRDQLGVEPVEEAMVEQAAARDREADAARRGAAKAEVRPGDQARPVTQDPAAPGAHAELLAMLTERRAYGLARYGTTLQPHTGRNTGRDLVDELVDGAAYAITLRHELEDLEAALLRLLQVWDTEPGAEKLRAMREAFGSARALLAQRGAL